MRGMLGEQTIRRIQGISESGCDVATEAINKIGNVTG